MIVSSFELQVVVSGRPVREYGHQGRTFVEGRSGSPFTLKFRNNTPSRVLAVPSVDGLSAIDGNPATGESRGYVVPGYSAIEINGWRRDLGTSADFVFTARDKSYAAQSAGDQNRGVIALKVFSEYIKMPACIPWTPLEIHHHHWDNGFRGTGLYGGSAVQPTITCCCATKEVGMNTQQFNASLSSPSSAQTKACYTTEAPAFNLGIGWGAEKMDRVSECSFERGIELATLEIYYDDAAGLSSYGVPLSKELAIERPAFPVSFGGFCRPPKVTV